MKWKTAKDLEQKYLESGSVNHLNSLLHIDKFSGVSKWLVYLALPGIILFFLNLFHLIPFSLNYVYLVIVIILLGFIFTPHGKTYNFVVVFVLFLVFAFVPTPYFQLTLELQEGEANAAFVDALEKVSKNPLKDLSQIHTYARGLVDVMNWIVIIVILLYAGGIVMDIANQKYGEAAKKAGKVLGAIAVIWIIYGVLEIVGEANITVWDTMGETADSFLKGVGVGNPWAQLTMQERPLLISLGIYRRIILAVPFVLLGASYAIRNLDFKSILTVKRIAKENIIKVKQSNVSYAIISFLLVLVIIYIGYFLTTAADTITLNPFIAIVFYISSVVVLFLLAFKFLILVTWQGIAHFISQLLKWTMAGMLMLFLWFQVIQPVFYQLNLIESPDAYLIFSQAGDAFNNKFVEQFFMVATPETLVFQIAFIGLGNRIYYQLRRGKINNAEVERLERKKEELVIRFDAIDIDKSTTRTNLKRIAKAAVLRKKIDQVERDLKKAKKEDVDEVPIRYFILPTLISSVVGSFFFSWFHSFRRGINFILWWQNPFFGMVYWGAGMVLSLVCFFCYPAAIAVHALNNLFSLLMAGA